MMFKMSFMLLILAFVVLRVHAQANVFKCSSLNITRCTAESRSADVLFLVDGSETMDVAFFYGQMLDYVEQLQCTLNDTLPNQNGMLIFSNKINWVIPLGQYTQAEWYQKIEAVRSDSSACCTCCTPLAEAFQAARDEFLLRGKNPTKVVIVITDGDPFQNDARTIADPVYNKFLWDPKTFDEARYTYRTVPRMANLLKEIGVKIILLGVPNRVLKRVNLPYFQGRLIQERMPSRFGLPNPSGDSQCIYRTNPFLAVCARVLYHGDYAFPITEFAYNGNSYDPSVLLTITTPEFCRPAITTRPSKVPSNAPSRRPSRTPSKAPSTGIPSFTPSKTPSRVPSRRPTISRPSRSPSKNPTTTLPSKTPSTTGPTKSPSRLPTTSRPSQIPSNQPTSSIPTRSPTTAKPSRSPTTTPTTSFPSRAPSASPTQFHLQGVDMYVLLDRSKSLTYPPEAEACRKAQGGVATDSNSLACWRLFVGFTQNLAMSLSNMREMGWKANKTHFNEGLRISVISFWCRNDQTDPESLWIGQNIDSAEAFATTMRFAMQLRPNFGTCPGEAIERVVMSIQRHDLITRPYKAAVILTDGVFYDMPVPKMASQGLVNFGVLTYALGIAMPPVAGTPYGMSAADILRQKNQLRHFVGGNMSRVFNFGAEGFNLLPKMANDIARYLDRDMTSEDRKTWWCGFTTKTRCVSTAPSGNQVYCKWMSDYVVKWPGGDLFACKDKGFCDWDESICKLDPYCYWDDDHCVTKSQWKNFSNSPQDDYEEDALINLNASTALQRAVGSDLAIVEDGDGY